MIFRRSLAECSNLCGHTHTRTGVRAPLRLAMLAKLEVSYFEVKAGHDGQLLHGQLLGGLLVTMATAALDFSAAAEVLWSGEPTQQRIRFSARLCVSVCDAAASRGVCFGEYGKDGV